MPFVHRQIEPFGAAIPEGSIALSRRAPSGVQGALRVKTEITIVDARAPQRKLPGTTRQERNGPDSQTAVPVLKKRG